MPTLDGSPPPLDEAAQAALDELEDVPSEPLVPPSPSGMARLLPRSLLGRQLLVIGLILGVGNGLLLQHFRGYAERDVVNAEQRRIGAVAQVGAGLVDGDLHEQSVVEAPGRDAFVAWTDAPEAVQAQHAALAHLARETELLSPAYTLRIRDSARARVTAEPDRPHPDALEFVYTSAEAPYWRHPITYRPSMAPAFFAGETTVSDRYADDHGSWVTAWAPVLDRSGSVVAVVGIDAPLATLLAPLGSRQWRDARLLGATFLLTFIAVGLLVRSLGRGLRDIEAAAARIEGGDYATPVQAFGFAEVVALARGLEGARRRVAEDMRRLEALRQTLGRRLAESAERVDARGRERRRRCSRLDADLRVSLTVAGSGRTLPARLIDITYDGMVLSTGRALAPDLAPGMLATVSLDMRDDSRDYTFQCHSESVIHIDENVHFTFAVSGGVRIEALPPRLAKVLNQRKALRVRPDPDTTLRVAVRRSPHVRPIPAEVLDLSSDGLKLVLPVDLRRFSSWGTRLDVALRFELEAPPFRLRGIVRNCNQLPDGRVAVGVSFDGTGQPAFEKHQQAISQWVMMTDRAQREARDRRVS